MTLSAEAEAIVRALAQVHPYASSYSPGTYRAEFDGMFCVFCDEEDSHDHADGCAYARAVSWVRRADAEREGGR